MKNKKGFTLVEVLIVVIIIAVLAALILPRFFAQTENAYVSEAQQMLGAIRRAQIRTQDMSGTTTNSAITSCPQVACTATEWQAIGMAAPATNGTAPWNYSCAAGGTSCTAARVNAPSGNERNGNTIVLANDGTWTCTGGTGTVRYAAQTTASQGCRA